MECERCGTRMVKAGFVNRSGGRRQRYQCTQCGYVVAPRREVTG